MCKTHKTNVTNLLVLNNKRDPTGTLTIRNQFIAEFNRRWRWLKSEVDKLITEDLFFHHRVDIPPSVFSTNRVEYIFEQDPANVDEFIEWLNTKMNAGVLHTLEGPGQAAVGSARWSDTYIESGYKKGMRDAYNRTDFGSTLLTEGQTTQQITSAAFLQPIHADRVGLLYTRTFNEMRGVTGAVSQKLSRILAQGMVDGVGPKQLAREMTKEINSIGVNRSKTIARTEVIRSHAEASLNSYESFGFEGVELEVEWSAANDERTCIECAALSGRVFTLDEARGMIPLHPNCRCVWLPVVDKK